MSKKNVTVTYVESGSKRQKSWNHQSHMHRWQLGLGYVAKIVMPFSPVLFFLILFLSIIPGTECNAKSDYRQSREYMKGVSSDALLKRGRMCSHFNNMPDSAVIYYTIVTQCDDTDLTNVVKAYQGLWYTYFFHFNNYVMANQAMQRALELSEDINLPRGELYLNLGMMYHGIASESRDSLLCCEAMRYLRLAFEESGREGNIHNRLLSLCNMVILAGDLGITRSFRGMMADMKTEAVEHKDIASDWLYDFSLLQYKGNLALDAARHADATGIFHRQEHMLPPASPANARFHLQSMISQSASLMADSCFNQAIDVLRRGLQNTRRFNIRDARMEIFRRLNTCFTSLDMPDSAYRYRSMYMELKDSLLNYAQTSSIREIGIYNQRRAIDREMERIKNNALRQRRVIIATVTAMLAIALFCFAIYRKKKKLQETNLILYDKNRELMRMEQELRDINRRLLDFQKPADSMEAKTSGYVLAPDAKKQISRKILDVMESSDSIYMQDFSAQTLAGLIGVNYSYISQVINEVLGTNFKTMVNDYRVKRACVMISTQAYDENFTIESLAAAVGFKSRNTFIISFKRLTGMTPSNYINIARKQRIDKTP